MIRLAGRPLGQPAADYLAPLDFNNTAWSASSVCAHWDIEVFFKPNAIRWQVWTALLLHAAHIGHWGQSFTRLFAVGRAAMWEGLDLLGLLRSYGTAKGSFILPGATHAAWLPGFEPKWVVSHGTAPA